MNQNYGIMIRLYTFLVISILFLNCENNNIIDFTPRKTQVAIQPLGQFPDDVLKEVQAGIDSMYDIESTVLQPIDLPKQAYYSPRNRYRADSLIRYLKKIKTSDYDKILGVTTSDISTTKGGYKDYGIMGLGFRPGKSCVGSIYRVQKGSMSRKHLISRFRKVTIHELGHNFGLKHCTYDPKCLMQSAKGKATTIDKADEILCKNCKRQIHHVLRE